MRQIDKGSVELENEILDQEEIETANEQGETDDVYQQDQQNQGNKSLNVNPNVQ